jgi:hypothetical protein
MTIFLHNDKVLSGNENFMQCTGDEPANGNFIGMHKIAIRKCELVLTFFKFVV